MFGSFNRQIFLSLPLAIAFLEGCAHNAVENTITISAPENQVLDNTGSQSISEPPVYRSLVKDGANGGEIVFNSPGTPDDLLAMFLDFDGEAAHRPWRTASKLLSHQGGLYRVEARYPGRAGINPMVVLAHEVEPMGEGYLIKFFVEKPAFGLKKFDGEYEIQPHGRNLSQVRELLFIHSGLPMVNASAADLKNGLAEDAKMIREWMPKRLALSKNQ
ncbi:MAG: hypothetical protein HY717_13510 [Planctomycetes bacterium]|nr:hypothetical protein [Planctomycetota bacterium]